MFAYARPTSIDEVHRLLLEQPAARLLSGGTDLLVGARKGTVDPPLVIDLKRVAELAPGIAEVDGRLRIGATTVMTALIADPRVREAFPALVEAAQVVGSIQIRNRATLAGNLCNASPAADTATPLLVHGARVRLFGPDGEREMAVADFFRGPGRTALAPGELVGAVELPLPGERTGAAFERMTRRRGVDLATVNLCCAVTAGGAVRLAMGAVGPTPLLAVDASGALADPELPDGERDRRLADLAAAATPITNVRATREYRAEMLLVLARRALVRAQRRLREGGDG